MNENGKMELWTKAGDLATEINQNGQPQNAVLWKQLRCVGNPVNKKRETFLMESFNFTR